MVQRLCTKFLRGRENSKGFGGTEGLQFQEVVSRLFGIPEIKCYVDIQYGCKMFQIFVMGVTVVWICWCIYNVKAECPVCGCVPCDCHPNEVKV